MRRVALKEKPKIILAGFSGYTRSLDYAKIAAIGQEVGAVLMADMAHIAGLIAAGVLPNPFDYGFNIITTTTHKTLRGPRGGLILTKGTVSNPLRAPEKTIDNLPTLIDREVFPGSQGGPHMNTIFAKAVAFGEALDPSFKVYANNILINAKRLADELLKRDFKLVGGGTDNHMIMIDMFGSYGLTGREAQDDLDKVGLPANCNAIPDDKLPPYRPSGLRLGTPAITTRGLKENDMVTIADWILQTVKAHGNDKKLATIKAEVVDFARRFPLPSDI
jgi:glycine hydroxymethyltransferase